MRCSVAHPLSDSTSQLRFPGREYLKMKFFVTGGTIFFDSHLVPALLKAGHDVVIVSFPNTWPSEKKLVMPNSILPQPRAIDPFLTERK